MREDEFSWQGSHDSDPRFFLRRSKDNPQEISDILLGNMARPEVVTLFAAFLDATNGVVNGKLLLSNVTSQNENHEQTVELFDQLTSIAAEALNQLGFSLVNRFLEPSGRNWNAVLMVERQIS